MNWISNFTSWVIRIAILAIFVISWSGIVLFFVAVVINIFHVPGLHFADMDITVLFLYSLVGAFTTTYVLVESERRIGAAAKSIEKGDKHAPKNIGPDSGRNSGN